MKGSKCELVPSDPILAGIVPEVYEYTPYSHKPIRPIYRVIIRLAVYASYVILLVGGMFVAGFFALWGFNILKELLR